MSKHPWTEPGRVNRNGQEVLFKTDEPGSLPGQRFYMMGCQGCHHRYKANGCDIWLRKCPKHQGGAT